MKYSNYTLLIGKCVVVFDYSKSAVFISEDATTDDLDRIYNSELFCDFECDMSDRLCSLDDIDFQSLVTL